MTADKPTRRDAMGAALAAGLGLGLAPRRGHAATSAPALPLYIGTYTEGTGSRGIYRTTLDLGTGALAEPVPVAETVNPSFLAFHPSRPWLFAVNEVGTLDGQPEGAVSGFVIGDDGGLTPINRQPSKGKAPCHLAVDPTGRALVVANYSSGTVGLLSIRDAGALATFGQVFSGADSGPPGPNRARQEGPHAHCVRFHPAGRFLVEADLGVDRLHVFTLEPDATRRGAGLKVAHVVAVRPGTGPRHLAFHPSGKFLYVNGELDSTANVFRFDPETGAVEVLQSLSTLPDGDRTDNTTAETVVHPSGRFVYVSNRGHDSIARFRVEDGGARLVPTGHTPTRGKTPRNFHVEPSGRWLIATNQVTNSLAVFRIDPESGDLEPVGEPVSVPAPVCVVAGSRE